ncbi:MAG TPA: diacylglycerol kinase [Burkholderiaceae bacterium]|nr:diacylglycerol kinase [Burkholderiaceae bacterium]
MAPPGTTRPTGLKRLKGALRYSLQGLQAAFRHEAAFRQELAVFAVLGPLALWLDVSRTEKLMLILSMLAVIIVELLNSAIESLADKVSPDHDVLVGRAKDLASAAVFLSLLCAGAVWLVVLLP